MSFSTRRKQAAPSFSALKLMDEVVKKRYNPAQWNITLHEHRTAITRR
ncbi:hypothetical protein ACNKHP_25645 [Shigella boydii]